MTVLVPSWPVQIDECVVLPSRLFWSPPALALGGQVGSRLARRGERSHGQSGGLVSGQDLPSVLCQADVTKCEARHRAQG